jgi:hypothetical protein
MEGVTTGSEALIPALLKNDKGEPADVIGELTLLVVQPDGTEKTFDLAEVTHLGTGEYNKAIVFKESGLWRYRWIDGEVVADEGTIEVESAFDEALAPDLTDLRVLVPQARRACEGPYGAPAGRPPLSESVIYGMVADACAEVILFSGTLFGHELLVKQRDPARGFPTEWKTAQTLNQWEGTIIICQVALDYFFHLFRDLKTSETLKNEGTEWTWALSANVLRNYLESLKEARDKALEGLRAHNPVLDTYASNIRIRDQATVGILEWWDTVSPGLSGSVGVPSGQEAGVIPWTPGWTGPGWSPE